ncbi:MAG: hypothetical protein HY424_00150 [Candidatus Levybacteria bacterium]|nr:hypothetical protein [Candidatus Levybacteria bacterium]
MLDINQPVQLLVEAASFISAFAAIAAGIIMGKFLRKFVTGILARGFKTIGIGIFILALGIVIDAVEIYIQALSFSSLSILLIAKQILFLIGTYIIVVGSKTMGDKLETLSKHTST